jgi:hypothetical protein
VRRARVMNNNRGRRLVMGVFGLVAFTAIVVLFAVGVDHRRHILPVGLATLVLWIGYFYALSRKYSK